MAAGETFRSNNLQVGQALGELPWNVSLAADNTLVNIQRFPFLRLTSDNATATNRTFTLTKGAVDGQMLHIVLVGGTGFAAELLNTGNVILAGNWTAAVNDYLTLQWDQLTDKWREVARGGASSGASSGSFTPVFTAGTNVATATAGLAHWMRVGNQVSVWGTGSIASTAAASTASAFQISLPVMSDLAAAGDLTGSGNLLSATGTPSAGATITADTTNNTALVAYNAAQTAAASLGYSFSYTVI